MIWSAFNGGFPDSEHFIHHIDENPLNNSLSNLKCVSKSEHNTIHHKNQICNFARKVMQYDLNGKFIAEYNSIREASKITGCGETRLSYTLKHGLKTKPRKFIWEYKTD